MIKHCLVYLAVLIAVLGSIIPALGEDVPAAKPRLIVWAHTDLEKKGAPTLDLEDLERYFVTQLDALRIDNVVPSATAKIPTGPTPDVYLLDLRVDAIRPGERAKWDDTYKDYVPDYVFNVDLSLTIRNSGRVVGTTGVRYEFHFANKNDSERIEPKRNAIGTAASQLAERFANAATAGDFGDVLKSIQAPPPTFWDRLKDGDNDAVAYAVIGGLFAIFTIAIVIALIVDSRSNARRRAYLEARQRAAEIEAQQRAPAAMQSPIEKPKPTARPDFDRRIEEARVLAFKTRDFSREWIAMAAKARCDELLASEEGICERHALRTLNMRALELEDKEIAEYAMEFHGHGSLVTYEALLAVRDWEYTLLQEARKLSKRVNTDSTVFDFLPTKPKPVPPPPPPPPDPQVEAAKRRAAAEEREKQRQQELAAAREREDKRKAEIARQRQEEIEALAHKTELSKKEVEVERFERKKRDYQQDLKPVVLDDAARELLQFRRTERHDLDVQLQATDMRADAEEDKITRATERAEAIFNNPKYNTGQTRTRILAVLQEYGFEESILPEKIRDLLNTNNTTEDYTDGVQ